MITSPSGKSYIGQTIHSVGTRLRGHRKTGSECVALARAIEKYGFANMRVSILGLFALADIDGAECDAILKYNTLVPDGYNLAVGGAGCRCSPNSEARRRMGDSRRGKHCSKQHKLAISIAHTGKVVSAETRRKLSEKAKARKLSLETRRRMSESGKARKWRPTPEHLAKMIAARHPK